MPPSESPPTVPDGYDPFTPTPDPFTPQAAMAARCPVHAVPDRPAVMVTGMEHVLAVLRDPDAFSSRSPRAAGGTPDASLIHLDGEEHARQRRLVNRAFTPRAVTTMAGGIRALAEELADRLAGTATADLVPGYAGPLSFTVMAEALGIPAGDRERFVEWADDAIAATSAQPAATDDAFRAYVLDVIRARRASPRDDLISGVVHATEGDDRLSDAQLIALVRLLIIAGIETTANLIASLLRLLLEDRSRWEEVAADRSLVPAAVEEALRLDPPLNWTPRLVLDGGAAVASCPIGPSTMVLVGLASANRDPAVHGRPDEWDLHRPPVDGPAHVAFGNGVHFCLGAALARLEAEIALDVLLDRFPDLRLAPGWVFEPRGPQMMRGCRSLDVVLAPAGRPARAPA